MTLPWAVGKRCSSVDGLPIAGAQLRREWQGVEHVVTVREHDFDAPAEESTLLPALPPVTKTGNREKRNEINNVTSVTSVAAPENESEVAADPAEYANWCRTPEPEPSATWQYDDDGEHGA